MTRSHDDVSQRLPQMTDPMTPAHASEDHHPKHRRGFAVIDRDKQRLIASMGGIAAHQKGTAHRWTREEARLAGRKGGAMTARRRSVLRSDGRQTAVEAAARPANEPDALAWGELRRECE